MRFLIIFGTCLIIFGITIRVECPCRSSFFGKSKTCRTSKKKMRYHSALTEALGNFKTPLSNETFLSDYKFMARTNLEVLSKKDIDIMNQQYRDLTRNYELRKNYQINNYGDEVNYNSQVGSFAQDLYHKIYSQQWQAQSKYYGDKIRNSDFFQSAIKQTPVQVTGGIVAISTGNEIELNLSPTTKLKTRTNVMTQTGSFKLETPVMNISTDIIMTAPSSRDPSNPSSADRFFFRFSRHFGFLGDLDTSATYGSTSSILTVSLNKPIIPHISMSLDSTNSLNSDLASIQPSSTSFRVNYGLSF